MNILILNWRDPKHPLAGGAETSTLEHAKYWKDKGAKVTWFASSFKNASKEDSIEGIKIRRAGNHYSVHFLFIFYWLLGKIDKDFDIIIDCFHFIPFFTPLYIRDKKIIAFIHEVAGKVWYKNLPFILAFIGEKLEPHFFKFYKNVPFIAVSNSTKKDLKEMGITGKSIEVIHNGVNTIKIDSSIKKEKEPTIIFLGRASRDKGIDDAIEAFSEIAKKNKNAKLWIVGREEKKGYLNSLLNSYDLNDERVKKIGYISEKKKFELLKKAWILIHPSYKEGWGLNVLEANSVGTPAVGYDVEGLRDSIIDKKTGLLSDIEPKSLAKKILLLIEDEQNYSKLSKEAKNWAKKFKWSKSAKESWRLLDRCRSYFMSKYRNKIYFYIGTTAELIKLAPVIHEFKKRSIRIKVITSGQHEINLDEMPKPLDDIEIYKSYHPKKAKSSSIRFFVWAISALFRSLYDLRREFKDKKNTYFIVHGDTVTSLIGSFIAKFYRLNLVHIESGLRSFNFLEPFPEELSRYVVSRLSNIHFCPNEWSVNNLKGYRGKKINTFENTSIESFSHAMKQKNKPSRISHIQKPYFVLVIHRQEHVVFGRKNTEDVLNTILQNAKKDLGCVLIGHELTLRFIASKGLTSQIEKQNVVVLPRLAYIEFIHLVKGSEYIVTDGGSNQEEAYYMGKPCLILRKRTERIEGLGENAVLSKLNMKKIQEFFKNYNQYKREEVEVRIPPSKIIVDYLLSI